MKSINIKYLFFIIPVIIKKVNGAARYPFALPESKNDCFRIGENANSEAVCKNFKNYYLPHTNGYSDYSSFSSWVKNNIVNVESTINPLLSDAGCSRNGDILPYREEVMCSFAILEALLHNTCKENLSLKSNPSYICREYCVEYAANLYSMCSNGDLKRVGYENLVVACGKFKNCKQEINNNPSTNDSKNIGTVVNKKDDVTDSLTNNNNNIIGGTDNNNVIGTNPNNNSIINNPSDLSSPSSTTSQSSSIGKGHILDGNIESEEKSDESSNNNIFYTLGLVMPIGLFVTIGIFYYKKKMNKPIDYEKNSYLSNYYASNLTNSNYTNSNGSSNLTSSHNTHTCNTNTNTNTNTLADNSFTTSHNRGGVFSMGITNPKDFSPTIPITTLNTRQLDTIATSTIAELISTATRINAVNNVNKNITQPLSPDDVNININTTNTNNYIYSQNNNQMTRQQQRQQQLLTASLPAPPRNINNASNDPLINSNEYEDLEQYSNSKYLSSSSLSYPPVMNKIKISNNPFDFCDDERHNDENKKLYLDHPELYLKHLEQVKYNNKFKTEEKELNARNQGPITQSFTFNTSNPGFSRESTTSAIDFNCCNSSMFSDLPELKMANGNNSINNNNNHHLNNNCNCSCCCSCSCCSSCNYSHSNNHNKINNSQCSCSSCGGMNPFDKNNKSNSFYHSSVSSESKKFNSFIAPISPIDENNNNNNNNQNNNHNHNHNHNNNNNINNSNHSNHSNHSNNNNNSNSNSSSSHKYNNHHGTDNESSQGHSSFCKSFSYCNSYSQSQSQSSSYDDDEGEESVVHSKFLTDSIINDNRASNTTNSEMNSFCSLKNKKLFSTSSYVDMNGSFSPSVMSISKEQSKLSKYTSPKIPLSVMIVIQAFEPRMEDELCLEVEDRILLLKVFDDGWGVGLNQMTGKQGVFPMEYVISSELIKCNNKFASQIEYRYELPNRTVSMAFSNCSFINTTLNDSVIHFDEDENEEEEEEEEKKENKEETKNDKVELKNEEKEDEKIKNI